MDTEIIALLWQRKESALEEISRQYGELLRSLARRLLPTREDAEECVNDALLDVWNTIPPQKPQSIASYACMLTRRRAVDRIRYLSSQKRGSGIYPVALDELEECVSGGIEFDEDNAALKEAINDFLAALPKKDRLLFVGRYFAFESIETLAARRGVTKNTVNIRLSRMRKKLRAFLEERSIFP